MKTRNEIEKMTESQIKEIALYTINQNNFTSYIVEAYNGTFNELTCNTYYNSKYIDYITYPDYVHNIKGLEAYIKYVKKQLSEKTFNDAELTIIKSYKDFRNKIDYIINIMPQKFESISIYNINANNTNYKYKAVSNLFKYEQDAIKICESYENLKELYFNKLLSDDAFLNEACIYEFYNHESPIDWEGIKPAMRTIGLNYNNLPSEKKIIINNAYKYVCNNFNA